MNKINVNTIENMFSTKYGTHEDERTVFYQTKSLDGTKPNTNPKTNPNPNTNTNTNPIQLFYAFFRTPSPDLQSSPKYIKTFILAADSTFWDTFPIPNENANNYIDILGQLMWPDIITI